LGEKPRNDIGLFEGLLPDGMAEAIVFGISRMAAGFLDGFDHFARLRNGNNRILAPVKNPKWHRGDAGGHLWIAAAAQWNRGRENIGALRDDIPCSVAAVGLTRHVDSSSVDVESRFDRTEYFENETCFGTQFIDTIHPVDRTLRNQNERWILSLILRLRPDARTRNLV